MCLLFGKDADAIFADTGFEHDRIYQRIENIEKDIRKFHNNEFKIHKVKNQKHGDLPSYIRKQMFYPSFHARFCTRLFKIEPIDDFLKQFESEGVELMIGLNADEEHSRTGNHGNLPYVSYTYPLIENGINRAMCEAILHKANLYPDFPSYMKRGGCKGCFYKSKKEYEAMIHLSPHEFDEVMELEEHIQDQRDQYFKIKKDMKPLREFKQNVLDQGLMFDPKEIYGQINNITQCGVFCNR